MASSSFSMARRTFTNMGGHAITKLRFHFVGLGTRSSSRKSGVSGIANTEREEQVRLPTYPCLLFFFGANGLVCNTELIPLIPEKEPEKNTALKTPSRKGTAEPSAQSSKGPRNMRSKTPIGNSMGELTAQLSKSKSKKKEEKEKRSSSTWRTTVGMDT
jgi:hypothetical protein